MPGRLVREYQQHSASSQLSHMRESEMDSYINVSLTTAVTEDSSSQKPQKRCNQPWWTGERWCAGSASSCPVPGSCQLPLKSRAKAMMWSSFCIAQRSSAQTLLWLRWGNSSELGKHLQFSLQTWIFSELLKTKVLDLNVLSPQEIINRKLEICFRARFPEVPEWDWQEPKAVNAGIDSAHVAEGSVCLPRRWHCGLSYHRIFFVSLYFIARSS